MIFRILAYAAIFYFVLRMIRSWTGQATKINSRSDRSAGEIDDVMIKDPHCQIYFPKREGVHLRKDGKDLYFCSEKCRDEYLNTHK